VQKNKTKQKKGEEKQIIKPLMLKMMGKQNLT